VVVDRVTASNSRGDAQGDTFAGIERFLLTDFADRFVGNGEGEMISGGIGNDTLLGGGGNDALWGEAGDDRLTGGTGNDSFSFTAGSGRDVITDFVAGTGVGDTLRFSLGSSFDTYDEIMAVTTQVGVNTMITIDSGSTIVLNNVLKSALVVDDFAFF
jgi:Ca2+-binding RTX toxin-like protein